MRECSQFALCAVVAMLPVLGTLRVCVAVLLRVCVGCLLKRTELAKPVKMPRLSCNTQGRGSVVRTHMIGYHVIR